MARRRAQSPAHSVQKGGQSRRKQTGAAHSVTESQQMLALAPILKKGKTNDKEIDRFRANVAADQKALGAELELRLRQAKEQDRRRKNELATALLNALQTPNRESRGNTPGLGDSNIAQNTLYTSAASVLRASADLVDTYDGLDKTITKTHYETATDVSEKWKEEIEWTGENLRKGARTALRSMQKVLGAGAQDAPDEDGDVDEDADEDMDGELNYEIPKRLKYAERGIKRIVKGLEEDGE